jgi:hypothetical protein
MYFRKAVTRLVYESFISFGKSTCQLLACHGIYSVLFLYVLPCMKHCTELYP